MGDAPQNKLVEVNRGPGMENKGGDCKKKQEMTREKHRDSSGK